METLSRLWILFDYRCPNWDKIVFTSPTPDIHSFHPNISEAFALLGISDKIKIIDKPARYAQVIEPIQCIKPREKVFAECTSVYDRIASAVQIPEDYGPLKIYLSRAHLPKAKLNEAGLEWFDNFFRRNGFSVIYPEQLSLAETIRAIRGAETVAAMSGTLPHNMLFAKEGATLWILEKYATSNNFQPSINIIKRLIVEAVDCNAMIWPVSAGLGPFIIYPNRIFRSFAKNHGLKGAEAWNEKKKKRAIQQFIRLYRRHYCRKTT